MTEARAAGVVVETTVISWLIDDRPNPLADTYRERIGSEPVVLALQTVMELRFGARRAGWGELRRRRLERRIVEIAVAQPDNEMITLCAELRMRCQQAGPALGNKLHDGRAYLLKAQLRPVFALKGAAGIALLEEWLNWARRCRIPSFVKLAKSITDHRAGIEAALPGRS